MFPHILVQRGTGTLRCDRHGGVGHGEGAADRVDGVSESRQQLFELAWQELGMSAGGGDEIQPLVPGVEPLPVETPLFRDAESTHRPDAVGRLGELPRICRQAAGRSPEDRRVRQDAAVGGGEGFRQAAGGWTTFQNTPAGFHSSNAATSTSKPSLRAN